MKCCVTLGSAMTALCLVAGVAAGGDFVDEVRRDFKMGLFPRQTLQDDIQPFDGKLGGFSAAAVRYTYPILIILHQMVQAAY